MQWLAGRHRAAMARAEFSPFIKKGLCNRMYGEISRATSQRGAPSRPGKKPRVYEKAPLAPIPSRAVRSSSALPDTHSVSESESESETETEDESVCIECEEYQRIPRVSFFVCE